MQVDFKCSPLSLKSPLDIFITPLLPTLHNLQVFTQSELIDQIDDHFQRDKLEQNQFQRHFQLGIQEQQ